MPDPASRLPARPSLEQLRKQAKELLQLHRAGDIAAAERFRAIRPQLIDPGRTEDVALADAQFVLAREHGFESWAKLVHHVEALQPSRLEALWCMYCRDTGDEATEHIAGLSRLKTYYAGKTRITDRSLEILGRMSSLERLEFWQTARVTDAGVAHLTRLPRLREISLDGLANVTRDGAAVFPAHVRVNYSV